MAQPTDPELQAWIEDASRLADSIRRLESLSTPQLRWRPAPGTWSITECVEHLTTTDRKAASFWRGPIARARAAGFSGRGPYPLGWLGGWWLKQVGPNPSRPVSAPAIFTPSSTADPATVLADFATHQRELIATIESLDGLNLVRIKARSAVTPLLRFNMAVWIASALAHQHRHLDQLARVRSHPDFPKE
jgi:hypothetical protein